VAPSAPNFRYDAKSRIAARPRPRTGEPLGAIDRLVHAGTAPRRHAHRAAVHSQLPSVARNRLRWLVHARAKRERGTAPFGFGDAVRERDLDSARSAATSIAASRTSPSTAAIGAVKVRPCSGRTSNCQPRKRHRESLLEQEAVTETPRLRREICAAARRSRWRATDRVRD
jgi:hypothetical protein